MDEPIALGDIFVGWNGRQYHFVEVTRLTAKLVWVKVLETERRGPNGGSDAPMIHHGDVLPLPGTYRSDVEHRMRPTQDDHGSSALSGRPVFVITDFTRWDGTPRTWDAD